jgi:hypothetical protein
VYGFSVGRHDPKGIVVVGLALPAVDAGSNADEKEALK